MTINSIISDLFQRATRYVHIILFPPGNTYGWF